MKCDYDPFELLTGTEYSVCVMIAERQMRGVALSRAARPHARARSRGRVGSGFTGRL